MMQQRRPDSAVPGMEELARFRALHPCTLRNVRGVRWEYIACGHGEDTVLLLPGAMGMAETAFHYVLAFEEQYRVLSLTYPAAVNTLDLLLAGIVELLDAEGSGRTHVIGGSYSGFVAQFLAGRYPDRVTSLLLSNTGVPSATQARYYRWLHRLLWPLPAGVLHGIMHASIRHFLPTDTPEQHFWRAYFAATIPQFSRPMILNRLRLMIEMQQGVAAAQAWRGPVLIVDAGADRMVPAADRAALRALYPQATCVELSDSGHVASLDNTDEYIALYREFLTARLSEARHRDGTQSGTE